MVGLIRWIGVDIDPDVLQVARKAGLPCAEMDFTSAMNFQDASFGVAMMTELLEHALSSDYRFATCIEF